MRGLKDLIQPNGVEESYYCSYIRGQARLLFEPRKGKLRGIMCREIVSSQEMPSGFFCSEIFVCRAKERCGEPDISCDLITITLSDLISRQSRSR